MTAVKFSLTPVFPDKLLMSNALFFPFFWKTATLTIINVTDLRNVCFIGHLYSSIRAQSIIPPHFRKSDFCQNKADITAKI